jgi:anti-sigma regulatory factor (Ser/Thr protein kinase)
LDSVEVKIASDPKYLKILRSTVYHLSKLCNFSNKEGNALTLAVDEAAANIIKHAYKNEKDKPIFMYCKIHDDRLEIILRDSGRKVDKKEIKSRELQDVKPGGLGVHFIKSTMDVVNYDNSLEDGNKLTLAKYLPGVRKHHAEG